MIFQRGCGKKSSASWGDLMSSQTRVSGVPGRMRIEFPKAEEVGYSISERW